MIPRITPVDGSFPCAICDWVCLSRIGLRSYMGAHQRSGGDGAVVVAPEGPPLAVSKERILPVTRGLPVHKK